MTTTPPAAAEYEFSAEQNETFKGLVRGMRRSGAAVGVASAILLAYQVVDHTGWLSLGNERPEVVGTIDHLVWYVLSAIGIVVAALLVKATAAFTAVIHSQGNDILHLMNGLASLGKIFSLIFAAATAGAVLLALSFSLLVVF